jgi:hypothetical protein
MDDRGELGIIDVDCCVANIIVGCFNNVCGCVLVRVTVVIVVGDVSIELTAMAISGSDAVYWCCSMVVSVVAWATACVIH